MSFPGGRGCYPGYEYQMVPQYTQLETEHGQPEKAVMSLTVTELVKQDVSQL